jgi:solute carrier family 25 thiamine pyrophosphate transporter 19
MLAGAVAGMTSRFAISPIDVIKIRWQLHHTTHAPKLITMLNSLLTTEGYRALWKGNWSAEWLYMSYGAVQFPVYQYLRDQWPDHRPDTMGEMICGGTAGLVATTVTYPFDLLRTRFAAQGSQKIYFSIGGAVRQIIRDEGVSGLYRGLLPSVIQIVPYMAITFASYQYFQDLLENSFIAGGLSGVTAKTVVMPFDLIRKRLQVQGPTRDNYIVDHIPKYRKRESITSIAKAIIEQEGVRRGLFRGWTAAMIKSGVGSATTFFVYDHIMRLAL